MKTKHFITLLLSILLVTLCAANASAASFQDVPADAWYVESVHYVSENGIMSGTGNNKFDPNGNVTRGMIVTILYRMEGNPSASGNSAFQDVSKGAYYEKAVNWAAKNGIVNGYSPTQFGPNDSITREQFAAILYRYCTYKQGNVSTKGSLNQYKDVGEISSYAKTAMLWANANGLITGTSATTLSPKGTATRAQAAAIMTRYIKNSSSEPAEQVEEQIKEQPTVTGGVNTPTFIIGSTSAKPGDSDIKISVAVKNNPGIASIGMYVAFDTDLILKAIEYDESVGGQFMQPANNNTPVRLTWISPFSDVDGDWTFATLTFDVSATAKTGTHPIAVSFDPDDVFNLNEDNIAFDVSNGSIFVSK